MYQLYDHYTTVTIRVSPSTPTEDRDKSSRLKLKALQCVILIMKWIKFDWSVTFVNSIRACEGVDGTFIHFKKHKCTPDTEIVILLRERIVTWLGLGRIRTFEWRQLVEGIVLSAECPSVIDQVLRAWRTRQWRYVDLAELKGSWQPVTVILPYPIPG